MMHYDPENIFAKIISREVPSDGIMFEDEHLIVLKDINPAADVHFLVIPKAEIATIKELTSEHAQLLLHMFTTATTQAKELGLVGYKTLFNVEREGGQIVPHLHLHVLGGEPKRFP